MAISVAPRVAIATTMDATSTVSGVAKRCMDLGLWSRYLCLWRRCSWLLRRARITDSLTGGAALRGVRLLRTSMKKGPAMAGPSLLRQRPDSTATKAAGAGKSALAHEP